MLTNNGEADAEWRVGEQLDHTGRGASAFTLTPSTGVIKVGRTGCTLQLQLDPVLTALACCA